MQYIYATRNALLDGSQMIVALTNVCAMLLLKAIEWLKERNLRVFSALCPPNLDNCPLTATGNEILKSYGALRTFMQNNPTIMI